MASKKRHQWTNEEKDALIAEFEALPKGAIAAQWCRQKGISPNWFRLMRDRRAQESKRGGSKKIGRFSPEGLKRVKEGQRKIWAERKAAIEAAAANPASIQWQDADEETKRRLLAEYDNLPRNDRATWRAAYGVNGDGAILTYYRQKFAKETDRQALIPHPKLSNSPARTSPARNGSNGHSPAVHLLPQAAPAPVVTLEDAINALQVKQDHMAEFLDLLKRMSRGQL